MPLRKLIQILLTVVIAAALTVWFASLFAPSVLSNSTTALTAIGTIALAASLVFRVASKRQSGAQDTQNSYEN